MEALASNGTKVVLIEKLDRLARDLMVQETIIAKLRTNEFDLISVTEPDLCVDDPSRKLMRQIFGAFAEYDRVMIVSKLKAARQRKRLGLVREGRSLRHEARGKTRLGTNPTARDFGPELLGHRDRVERGGYQASRCYRQVA